MKRREGKKPNRYTLSNIILGVYRERNLELAFRDQMVDLAIGADNCEIEREENI